jgi:hypothetical protein
MRTPARRLCRCTIAALAFAAAQALAQPAPPPPALEPLPEIPPPPGVTSDADLEPAVTIRRTDTEVREEARVNGQIRWIRVTPRGGRPYFLVPDQNGETYIRRDSLETGLKVPLWLLYSF